VLLLFDGRAATERGYRSFEAIETRVAARFGDLVQSHVVTPRERPPESLRFRGRVLLDPERRVHHRYGAGAECLYLLRPDGYIGHRCQPADEGRLLAHLEHTLL
jgi:hypothetical protein